MSLLTNGREGRLLRAMKLFESGSVKACLESLKKLKGKEIFPGYFLINIKGDEILVHELKNESEEDGFGYIWYPVDVFIDLFVKDVYRRGV